MLAQRDGRGRPFTIVGGQAVNYWAERYLAREPALGVFRPFTSKDLDLVGTTDEARQVAAATDWKFLPPAPDAFVMQAKLRRGVLLVEFLRPDGLDLFSPDQAEFRVGAPHGTVLVRVLNPAELLMKKVALAVDVPQDGVGEEIAPRQDVRHAQMLARVIPHYLGELLAALPDANPSQRTAAVQPLVALLAGVRRSGSGRRFESTYPGALPWGGLLPAVVRALPFDAVHQRCLAELA